MTSVFSGRVRGAANMLWELGGYSSPWPGEMETDFTEEFWQADVQGKALQEEGTVREKAGRQA